MSIFAAAMSKHILYIGIGTNLENSEIAIRWAERKLAEAFRGEQRFSTPQRTEPIGINCPRMFTNQVAWVETTVPTTFIRPLLKSLERQFGRKPEDLAKGLVKLDLDLLWMDGEVLRQEDWERDYVQSAVAELS